MTAAPSTAGPSPHQPAFEPDLVLLLCGDPGDAVTQALVSGRAQLGWPLVAVTVQQLLDGVALGERWTVHGRPVDPQRTAVINRLPTADRLEPGDGTGATPADTATADTAPADTAPADTAPADAAAARQAVWSRLRRELGRFAYVSSLPTATSLSGCHGSLLDQWQDLPRLVPGLQVPAHSAASVLRSLQGDVFSVNRFTPYSLGLPLQQAGASPLPAAQRLDYVRPAGQLVHLAQVGDTMFFANAPPGMTPAQQQAMVAVARALALVSPLRILEHAFFLGDPVDGAPVLYSSFPVPVLSGGHPLYAQLVQQGLRNDIQRWRGSGAAGSGAAAGTGAGAQWHAAWAKAGADGVDGPVADADGVHGAVHAVVQALHFGAKPAMQLDGSNRFNVVADFDSPSSWPDVPYDTAAAPARHDAAMRTRIATVLDAAARTMAARVPAAFSLVNAQLQQVLLRRCDGQPGTSTSHRAHVGSCLLTNLHQPDMDVALLVAMEALTHEAIHQLLYRNEQAHGLFCDLAPTPTLRSPWTGARLPLHSLVHASFVWFGLLTLWNTLALTPASSAEAAHARARVAHCLFGFAFLDDLLDSPAFPLTSVSPPVVAALRSLAATARGATQAAEPAATLRQAALARQQAGWPAALGAALSAAFDADLCAAARAGAAGTAASAVAAT